MEEIATTDAKPSQEPKSTLPPKKRVILWCCDGDGTLYRGNLHDAVIRKIKSDPAFRALWKADCEAKEKEAKGDEAKEAIEIAKKRWADAVWDFAKEELSLIGLTYVWKAVITRIIEEGDYFTIISFNSFGDIIFPRHLEENFKLPPDFIAQHIKIVSRYPAPGEPTDNKRLHIAEMKTKLGLENIPAGDIVVIDDNTDNTGDAHDQGHVIIEANPYTGVHVGDMVDMFEDLTGKKVFPARNENLFGSDGAASSGSSSKDLECLIRYSSRSPSPSPVTGRRPSRSPLSCSQENVSTAESTTDIKNSNLLK